MNRMTKIFVLAILFVPTTFSLYFRKTWQESALLLFASIISILFINIDKYEIFKLSKDGVEIKTKIKEIDAYLDLLKKNVSNLLNIQIDLLQRQGNNCYGSYQDIRKLQDTMATAGIEEKSFDEKIEKMRKSLKYSFIHEQEISFSDIKRNESSDEKKEAWEKFIKELIPSYSDLKFDLISYYPEFVAPCKSNLIDSVHSFTDQMISLEPERKTEILSWKNKMIEVLEFSLD